MSSKRTIVITGCSSGFGRVSALDLAQRHHSRVDALLPSRHTLGLPGPTDDEVVIIIERDSQQKLQRLK